MLSIFGSLRCHGYYIYRLHEAVLISRRLSQDSRRESVTDENMYSYSGKSPVTSQDIEVSLRQRSHHLLEVRSNKEL